MATIDSSEAALLRAYAAIRLSTDDREIHALCDAAAAGDEEARGALEFRVDEEVQKGNA